MQKQYCLGSGVCTWLLIIDAKRCSLFFSFKRGNGSIWALDKICAIPWDGVAVYLFEQSMTTFDARWCHVWLYLQDSTWNCPEKEPNIYIKP